MSQWWTYGLHDFLLFAPRTYYRLFELYNEAVWPLHLVAIALGAALVVLAWRGGARGACAILALCWFWVAWAFLLQRYATINWAARWYAVAFAIEGAVLLLAAARLPSRGGGPRVVALALLLVALVGYPVSGALFGRPWSQAEMFALAPDPTALATIAILLATRTSARGGFAATPTQRLLAFLPWPIPLLWCLVSGATLWAMDAPDAWLLPAAATLAVGAVWRRI